MLLLGCATSVPWEHPNMSLIELQRLDAENELEASVNLEEMHLWIPPSDSELAMRRKRQEKLNRVAGAVDKLILDFRRVQEGGDSLASTITMADSRIDSINNEITDKVNQKNEKFNQLKQDTDKIKSSVLKAESDIRQIKKKPVARVAPTVYKNYYRDAIQFFRKGKYKKSINRFKRALSGNQPRSLKDNIQFGIGSAYFKLKQYPSAIRSLGSVIDKYPGQDKWFSAHVLLGMIYGLDGQKSKSMYILEKALKNNPPINIRKILEKLIVITQEDDFYANS